MGNYGEPDSSVEEVAGNRGGAAESAKPTAQKQPPWVSVENKQDAAGKEPLIGLIGTRRKLDDKDAGLAPSCTIYE